MRKKVIKYLVLFSTLGFFACNFNYINSKAVGELDSSEEAVEVSEKDEIDVASDTDVVSEVVYNDANVSISSALDRYIAYNSTSALDEILGIGVSEEVTEKSKNEESSNEEEGQLSGSYIDFSNKAIVTTSGQVNIRQNADVNSDKIGIINNGGLVTVVEKGSEWSHIKSGNCDGYIKNEFLAFGSDAKTYAENNLQKVAVVNATTLRLRESDSEDSNCLTLLTGGEEYGILSQGNAWTKVEVDDSLSGYVKNEYISISYRTSKAIAVNSDPTATETASNNKTTTEAVAQASQDATTTAPATEAPATEESVTTPAPAVNPNAQDVCNFALQFVGNPYVYGGSSLTDGTDCSGFTMSVYANFGVYLPHSSKAQANCGTEVSLSEVAPGDIIFYKNGGTTIGHAALYIGGGQVVHASTEKTGIIVSNMYYSTPCKAIRVY